MRYRAKPNQICPDHRSLLAPGNRRDLLLGFILFPLLDMAATLINITGLFHAEVYSVIVGFHGILQVKFDTSKEKKH